MAILSGDDLLRVLQRIEDAVNAAPAPVAVNNFPATQPVSMAAVPTGAALDATLGTTNTALGGLTETAPASDTASSGLNGRLQRVAQRLTSLLALLPAALATNGGLKVEQNGAAYNADTVMQNAATALGNGTVMDVSGMSAAAVQVTGTFVGTITWEATIDGATWVAVPLANLSYTPNGVGPLAATAVAAPGIFARNVGGFKLMRARISAYTGGSITVTGHTVSSADFNAHMPMPVALYRADGQVVVNVPNVDALTAGSNFAGTLGALNYTFNGGTFDRARNNTDLSLLASAARTVNTGSADQTNYNGDRLLLFVNVSNIGTGSISPSIEVKDSITGDYFSIWTAAVPLTASGDYVYHFADGAGAGGTFTEKLPFGLAARTWRCKMIANNANSATYSVSGVTGI